MMIRFAKLLGFFVLYMREIVVSNIRVARDVLRREPRLCPGIVAVELDLKKEFSIFVLGNMVTMTPGTLTMDVSEDKRFLYVHSIYAADPQQVKAEIKQVFERRIGEIFE